MNKNLMKATVCQRFLSQAAATPGRLAVTAQDGAYSFEALNRQTDLIAEMLQQRGIGAGGVCGVLMDRSKHFVPSVLAVLKMGAAYLPLDPSAPMVRNLGFLSQGEAALLLTTGAALEACDDSTGYHQAMHLLHADTLESGGRSLPVLQTPVPRDAAYLISTSGSTGEPKVAINYQHSLANLVVALEEAVYARLTTPLNVAVVAPFVFDPSVQQIFASLLLGHHLFIVPDDVRLDGSAMLRYFVEHTIAVTDGTPTHLKLLTEASGSVGDRIPVQHLLIGGERLPAEVVCRFWDRFSDPRPAITNLYGVAECAVDATSYLVDRQEIEALGVVPVGWPLRGVDIEILSDEGQPVKAGEAGELAIGGRAVGAGYAGLPELTRERFIERPDSDGAMLYRTGDKARVLRTGQLDFLGRLDRQIKIRGYRIEPAEIEAAICCFDATDGDVSSEAAAPSTNWGVCERCLLDARHPRVVIRDGICSVCRSFDVYRDHIDAYFGTQEDFHQLMATARAERDGGPDCLLLYSGGKDSSYVLHRLLDSGYEVATFTFDNGFISNTALETIQRVTSKHGIDHTTRKLDGMRQVFADSLRQTSTVCDGCFRSLTLLSTQLAQEKGINVVITGLSRGQVFETKLKRLFEAGVVDSEEIDERLQTHRQLYNTRDDGISKSLNVFAGDDRNDRIHYLDYFRYDASSTQSVRDFLVTRDDLWKAPKDTGLCSTNCRINDVGIHVHQLEKGFHNYVAPLSWDIRLGVVSRQEAARELGSVSDRGAVEKILRYIGHQPRNRSVGVIQDAVVVQREGAGGNPRLYGYYLSSGHLNPAELRDHLTAILPSYMIPRVLMRVDSLPISPNGKVDLEKLPLPEHESASESAPSDRREEKLVKLWREVLGVQHIATDDNFFDLGGESLEATILLSLIEQEFGAQLSVMQAFKQPTIKEIAKLVGRN